MSVDFTAIEKTLSDAATQAQFDLTSAKNAKKAEQTKLGDAQELEDKAAADAELTKRLLETFKVALAVGTEAAKIETGIKKEFFQHRWLTPSVYWTAVGLTSALWLYTLGHLIFKWPVP